MSRRLILLALAFSVLAFGQKKFAIFGDHGICAPHNGHGSGCGPTGELVGSGEGPVRTLLDSANFGSYDYLWIAGDTSNTRGESSAVSRAILAHVLTTVSAGSNVTVTLDPQCDGQVGGFGNCFTVGGVTRTAMRLYGSDGFRKANAGQSGMFWTGTGPTWTMPSNTYWLSIGEGTANWEVVQAKTVADTTFTANLVHGHNAGEIIRGSDHIWYMDKLYANTYHAALGNHDYPCGSLAFCTGSYVTPANIVSIQGDGASTVTVTTSATVSSIATYPYVRIAGTTTYDGDWVAASASGTTLTFTMTSAPSTLVSTGTYSQETTTMPAPSATQVPITSSMPSAIQASLDYFNTYSPDTIGSVANRPWWYKQYGAAAGAKLLTMFAAFSDVDYTTEQDAFFRPKIQACGTPGPDFSWWCVGMMHRETYGRCVGGVAGFSESFRANFPLAEIHAVFHGHMHSHNITEAPNAPLYNNLSHATSQAGARYIPYITVGTGGDALDDGTITDTNTANNCAGSGVFSAPGGTSFTQPNGASGTVVSSPSTSYCYQCNILTGAENSLVDPANNGLATELSWHGAGRVTVTPRMLKYEFFNHTHTTAGTAPMITYVINRGMGPGVSTIGH